MWVVSIGTSQRRADLLPLDEYGPSKTLGYNGEYSCFCSSCDGGNATTETHWNAGGENRYM